MLCNFLQAFLRCAEALLALETEGSCDHRNRQDAHFASNFGDNWCRTGPGTAAHAGRYKDHIRAVQRVSDAIFIFKCRRTTHFGLAPAPRPLVMLAPNCSTVLE